MLPADGRRLCRSASGWQREGLVWSFARSSRWRVPEPPSREPFGLTQSCPTGRGEFPDSLEGSGDHRGSSNTEGKRVRKFIISVISLVALAAVIAVPFANAATTDANGVVTVSKGEIMAQFPSMNRRHSRRSPWPMASRSPAPTCSPRRPPPVWLLGRHHPEPLPQHAPHHPIALTEIYNGSADKITGWNLGAKGASVITESNTGGTASSGRFPDYTTICAGHGSVTNPFATLAQSHSDVTTFNVQRHGRQHRGQPVRGPDRLIQLRTKATNPHHNSAPRLPQRGALVVFDPQPATAQVSPRPRIYLRRAGSRARCSAWRLALRCLSRLVPFPDPAARGPLAPPASGLLCEQRPDRVGAGVQAAHPARVAIVTSA